MLQDLARQSNLRQGVSCIVFSFDIQPYDLTQKEQAPGSVTTMLDVLQCEFVDPCTVMKCTYRPPCLCLYTGDFCSLRLAYATAPFLCTAGCRTARRRTRCATC